MGAALFVVLNAQAPEFDAHVNGKTVARHSPRLERLATELGVDPLEAFVSMDPAELADLVEELSEADAAGVLGGAEARWHDPARGLASVRALIAHLEGAGSATPHATELAEDLRGFADVLGRAQQAGLAFHLQWDV